jgi:Rrf2 family cysteine metabolism transcriptional repressor
MRISAKAEYACVAMLELASGSGDEPRRVKDIAEAHRISPRFLIQILLQLKAAGLVASVRGASGGYQLARPADTISLADVIGAIDDLSATSHAALTDTAPTPFVATLLEVWREIHAEEQRMLARLTLGDLVRRIRQGGALTYQI